jgi:ATP-dependent 26S proteasome regulatory subunit
LRPSLVFIEDIDLIGQNRDAPLVSLLAILDGVEENREIVTVATTNYLEMLDTALSERPSRFDRVIKLNRPAPAERLQLVNSQCLKIPLSPETQSYIAARAGGCTPAQIQEIVHSLVIDRIQKNGNDEEAFDPSRSDVDKAVARISGMNRSPLGFCSREKAA